MTYTVYKSTDVDAPQLPDNLSILKACLVTGYGTGADEKQGAGWTLVFDDAKKMVFQPVDVKGENLMLRLDATNRYNPLISAWKTMTDIDTGDKAYDAGPLSRNSGEWILVATASWFLLLQSDSSEPGVFSQFFHGNLGFLPDNDKKTITMNGSNSTIISTRSYSLVASNSTKKQSNNKALSINAAFNTRNTNTTNTGDFVWCDISVSDEDGIIGILPVLKATPVNAGLATWHQIEPDVYALKVFHNTEVKQMVMDFTNVS